MSTMVRAPSSVNRRTASSCFFFNDTATTEIYTLSLHDALPICCNHRRRGPCHRLGIRKYFQRSEEHTSELQSPCNLVCRLLLEKKKPKPCTAAASARTRARVADGGVFLHA